MSHDERCTYAVPENHISRTHGRHAHHRLLQLEMWMGEWVRGGSEEEVALGVDAGEV